MGTGLSFHRLCHALAPSSAEPRALPSCLQQLQCECVKVLFKRLCTDRKMLSAVYKFVKFPVQTSLLSSPPSLQPRATGSRNQHCPVPWHGFRVTAFPQDWEAESG